MVPPYGGKGELCAYGDTYMENVSWMKKNHMVDEILLLCHETLNKVAELRIRPNRFFFLVLRDLV